MRCGNAEISAPRCLETSDRHCASRPTALYSKHISTIRDIARCFNEVYYTSAARSFFSEIHIHPSTPCAFVQGYRKVRPEQCIAFHTEPLENAFIAIITHLIFEVFRSCSHSFHSIPFEKRSIDSSHYNYEKSKLELD